MTQEVQPLTWQKRTNIEEHQQFFAKINEVVGQLSGTVERSETALEEANTALTNARTAVATANAASAQAVEAVTAVAGYNTRLAAVEVQAAVNKSDISQLDAETQDLYDRDAQSVKLSADRVQVITGGLDLRGTNRAPNTSVGADDTVIANGRRVVQELNAYEQMVRTSGNQTITGVKTVGGQINMINRPVYSLTNANLDSSAWVKVYSWGASSTQRMIWVDVFDRLNGRSARYVVSGTDSNGTIRRDLGVNALDGNIKLAYVDGTLTLFTNKRRATFNVVINAISGSTSYFDIKIENMMVPVDEPTTDAYTWVVGVTE